MRQLFASVSALALGANCLHVLSVTSDLQDSVQDVMQQQTAVLEGFVLKAVIGL